ncbi:MAG: tRNA (adenosine(37)-N6)-threonylcarbamoyltransferase complex ATPase subunit type 1 TsaE [Cytophagales bacterium CG12_big_fil_rev_8_21_14_0_65_40_12]|nr:MAG: tRNA (adenosine(37)-N6)-threonylcarbamoyltransferase complex ATPase subunit type 1 TsaE [Cytophagales bacterium CG12_big_fil_rev_8_21_14_0_65_40_12]PIW05672.1 MAG: tRNA (adenosine(37)-N6)-threonylcarbamoyltransferase complex ATPase subunit type 1 TsaE [Cytophagales bacterium CG17_big_fil_post_rev_8_21_14_2_50_40_13]
MEAELTLKSTGLDDLNTLSRRVIEFGKEYKIWLLMGRMGAGKTTFSKALCAELGVIDLVQSPTFSLVNEYETDSGATIYHFDFYRVSQAEEALNIGVEEYFYSGNLCLIEWPENISELIPDEYLKIEIEVEGDESRMIKLTKHD